MKIRLSVKVIAPRSESITSLISEEIDIDDVYQIQIISALDMLQKGAWEKVYYMQIFLFIPFTSINQIDQMRCKLID